LFCFHCLNYMFRNYKTYTRSLEIYVSQFPDEVMDNEGKLCQEKNKWPRYSP
jgi:hypothetical protein